MTALLVPVRDLNPQNGDSTAPVNRGRSCCSLDKHLNIKCQLQLQVFEAYLKCDFWFVRILVTSHRDSPAADRGLGRVGGNILESRVLSVGSVVQLPRSHTPSTVFRTSFKPMTCAGYFLKHTVRNVLCWNKLNEGAHTSAANPLKMSGGGEELPKITPIDYRPKIGIFGCVPQADVWKCMNFHFVQRSTWLNLFTSRGKLWKQRFYQTSLSGLCMGVWS